MRTLRPEEAAWSRSRILRRKKKSEMSVLLVLTWLLCFWVIFLLKLILCTNVLWWLTWVSRHVFSLYKKHHKRCSCDVIKGRSYVVVALEMGQNQQLPLKNVYYSSLDYWDFCNPFFESNFLFSRLWSFRKVLSEVCNLRVRLVYQLHVCTIFLP